MITTGFFVVAEVTRDSIKYLNFDSSTNEPYASDTLTSPYLKLQALYALSQAKELRLMANPRIYELALVSK